jgi:hypothetical protein
MMEKLLKGFSQKRRRSAVAATTNPANTILIFRGLPSQGYFSNMRFMPCAS